MRYLVQRNARTVVSYDDRDEAEEVCDAYAIANPGRVYEVQDRESGAIVYQRVSEYAIADAFTPPDPFSRR